MKIVALLEGDASGGFTDRTAQFRGLSIDAQVSDAISTYIAGSLEVGSGTNLEVVDSAGRDVTVTVYE